MSTKQSFSGNYFIKAVSLVTLATFNLVSGIKALDVFGLGIEAAQAVPVSCNSEWAQESLAFLVNRIGHIPPFFFCYEIDKKQIETVNIVFDETDVRMGHRHALIAECDTDCLDIDLSVYDKDGRFVGSDTSTDSYAEVVINNINAGDQFMVKMMMYECRTSFCGAVLGSTPRF